MYAKGNPGNSNLVLKSHNRDCDSVTYRPTENGNLGYYYLHFDYKICIGSRSGGCPKENEHVYIPKEACQVDDICQNALSYVYQRKFAHEKKHMIQCYLGRRIKIIWVNYDSAKTTVVLTKARKFMQHKCDGKITCTFSIRKADFLGSSSCPGESDTFLVRYTCEVGAKLAALKANGKKSATSFQIQLGVLQGDDKFVQIVVSKIRSNSTPTYHPGKDLLPYDVNTVDNQSYIAAQLDGTNINQNGVFTVGDGKRYAPTSTRKRRSTNYRNVELEAKTYYSVFKEHLKMQIYTTIQIGWTLSKQISCYKLQRSRPP
ncbi:Hypothetical predicted protein [Paramuricea clavata]|uniref:Uncharacterized protein n=1 Tax=Paramuricea clavata TaxID=317549 RepID=A0A6S7GNB8_PARCT|nr:Hypothetical predicted protein [Paramuricea clavata]